MTTPDPRDAEAPAIPCEGCRGPSTHKNRDPRADAFNAWWCDTCDPAPAVEDIAHRLVPCTSCGLKILVPLGSETGVACASCGADAFGVQS